MSIAFRTDASPSLGHGHVARCRSLALASGIDPSRIHFVCADLPGLPAARLRQDGFRLHLLPESEAATGSGSWETDAAWTRSRLREDLPGWIVVDNYSLGIGWESAMRALGPPIACIDDGAQREHDCDLLVDHNPGCTASDYATLIPRAAHCAAGPEFALLRPGFAALHDAALRRTMPALVSHLMVSMGGSDPTQASRDAIAALEAIELPAECEITLVIGAGSPEAAELQRSSGSLRSISRVLVDPPDFDALLARSDLVIGAGGVSALERCCLGIPSLVVVVAANQRRGSAALLARGAVLDVVEQDELALALLDIDLSQRRRAAVSAAGLALVDGRGAARVAGLMRELHHG